MRLEASRAVFGASHFLNVAQLACFTGIASKQAHVLLNMKQFNSGLYKSRTLHSGYAEGESRRGTYASCIIPAETNCIRVYNTIATWEHRGVYVRTVFTVDLHSTPQRAKSSGTQHPQLC